MHPLANMIALIPQFLTLSLSEHMPYLFKEQISTEYLSGRSRAPEGEFQRILNRLDQGNNTVKGHKGIRLKKVAKFVVATAVMGTMVLKD